MTLNFAETILSLAMANAVAEEKRLLAWLGQHMKGGGSSNLALDTWKVWSAVRGEGRDLAPPVPQETPPRGILLVWPRCRIRIENTGLQSCVTLEAPDGNPLLESVEFCGRWPESCLDSLDRYRDMLRRLM